MAKVLRLFTEEDKMATCRFIIEVRLPDGVGVNDMKRYISNAVKVDCGSLSPKDPLFNLDRPSVKVYSATTAKIEEILRVHLKSLKSRLKSLEEDSTKTLLKEAIDHLEYCGYGDYWERECSKDLREKLNKWVKNNG